MGGGLGSLANVASVTPGAAGITQATNALALDTCCDVPTDTAVAYSTAQQLIITAWNVLFATVLVVIVFGWTGGKQLVGSSYDDAKERAADMKEQRKVKREAKREERRGARFGDGASPRGERGGRAGPGPVAWDG